MKKRIISIIIAVVICFSVIISASAEANGQIFDNADSYIYGETEDAPESPEEIQNNSEKGVPLSRLPIALIVGLVIGFLIIYGIASKNKSVRMQKNATVYTRPGSLVITGSSDNFLYKNVERREKPKQTEKK